MVQNQCNFSFKHYEDCIKSAVKKGYTFLKFKEYNQAQNYEKIIFMRHDVDIHVDNAVKLANIEYQNGVVATYFVRMLGVYNPWNINNYYKLKKILALGHEIGLHYEPDFSLLNKRDLATDLKFYIRMLNSLIETDIFSISPHEPTRTGSLNLPQELREEFGNYIHAYDDFFMKQCKYISDSSCYWREGCMHEFIYKDTKKLCILTHPFWWYENSPIENY